MHEPISSRLEVMIGSFVRTMVLLKIPLVLEVSASVFHD
jgi:hypothetical protein